MPAGQCLFVKIYLMSKERNKIQYKICPRTKQIGSFGYSSMPSMMKIFEINYWLLNPYQFCDHFHPISYFTAFYKYLMYYFLMITVKRVPISPWKQDICIHLWSVLLYSKSLLYLCKLMANCSAWDTCVLFLPTMLEIHFM